MYIRPLKLLRALQRLALARAARRALPCDDILGVVTDALRREPVAPARAMEFVRYLQVRAAILPPP